MGIKQSSIRPCVSKDMNLDIKGKRAKSVFDIHFLLCTVKTKSSCKNDLAHIICFHYIYYVLGDMIAV